MTPQERTVLEARLGERMRAFESKHHTPKHLNAPKWKRTTNVEDNHLKILRATQTPKTVVEIAEATGFTADYARKMIATLRKTKRMAQNGTRPNGNRTAPLYIALEKPKESNRDLVRSKLTTDPQTRNILADLSGLEPKQVSDVLKALHQSGEAKQVTYGKWVKL